MDWFFDEWLYRMGHPVFQIARSYDAAARKLTLTVKQTQKPDPEWQYPQVGLFQTPVDIELVTGGVTRVERVMIEPKEEQSFTFAADSDPQLVNFDYGNTLIKEVEFQKSTAELLYQVSRDQDSMGRLWALGQLTKRMTNETTPVPERDQITSQLASTLQSDKFWGIRLEAATSLSNGGPIARPALIAAAKDPNPRVRARAITSLGSSKDPALFQTYLQALTDQSYAVIRAAALALGQTGNPEAYPALAKLVETPSWRETIKISAVNGLAALGDRRGLALGLQLAEKGNPPGVRAAALKLVGSAAKDDPRAFTVLSNAFTEAFEKADFTVSTGAAEGLTTLGDVRGVALFEEALKKPDASRQLKTVVNQMLEKLRRTAAAAPPTAPRNP